jgi:hypothetical protein
MEHERPCHTRQLTDKQCMTPGSSGMQWCHIMQIHTYNSWVGSVCDQMRALSAYPCAKQDVVNGLHAQHERVVLVGDLVLVAAEAAAGPDVVLPQPGLRLVQRCVPRHARRGVPVFDPPAVSIQAPSTLILLRLASTADQPSTINTRAGTAWHIASHVSSSWVHTAPQRQRRSGRSCQRMLCRNVKLLVACRQWLVSPVVDGHDLVCGQEQAGVDGALYCFLHDGWPCPACKLLLLLQ